jgi:acetyl-CoA carboxylase biotin carboxylase subunit
VYAGWTVPLDYDPMLAKVAVWAPSRDLAVERMRRALREFVVSGIRTNIAWFDEVLAHPDFRAGALSTAFLDRFERAKSEDDDLEIEAVAALVASMSATLGVPSALGAPSSSTASNKSNTRSRSSAWRDAGRAEMMR